ncbi:squalene/phytoene synthase family protein, partial [Hyphomicrobium sp.]|uniref:squalene/phytoene synthase family protein n=1 Tax=Hyphomicrobium sp. TaxID=82 RepID=UPI002C9559BE
MTVDTAYKSGKSEHDENFPVASRIIAPRYRAPILAFYRFARAADDAADNADLDPSSKLAILDALEDTLLGKSEAAADALPLRFELAARDLSPQHALDLLKAFRQDVVKTRYTTWAELIDYCRYSAMPVGRFVLDVHGESQKTW